MRHQLQVRWFIQRRDLDAVLDMESWEADRWGRGDIVAALHRNTIGFVVERGDTVCGWMVYSLGRHHLEVLRLLVDADQRRKGCGRALHQRLLTALASHHRTFLGVTLEETQLSAQLFLRSLGWKAVRVLRSTDDQPDSFRFLYHLDCLSDADTVAGDIAHDLGGEG